MSTRKRKLRSISYYLGDRKRMFQEMFSCIPQDEIQSVMPPELRCMPFGELKAELLILLLQMPEKDIIDALEGRKVVANVTLSDEEDESKIDNRDVAVLSDDVKSNSKTRIEVLDDDEDVLEINIEESEMKEIGRGYDDGNKKVKLERRKVQNRKKRRTEEHTNESNDVETYRNRSLLELLELELRAKAIRSLLRKEQGGDDDEHEKSVACEAAEGEKLGKQEFEIVTSDEDDVIPVEENLPEIILSSESEGEEVIHVENENNDGAPTNVTVQVIGQDESNDEEREKDVQQSWTDRWLHSESVKNVVATSKMLTSVRKKIINTLKEKKRMDSKEKQTEDRQPTKQGEFISQESTSNRETLSRGSSKQDSGTKVTGDVRDGHPTLNKKENSAMSEQNQSSEEVFLELQSP